MSQQSTVNNPQTHGIAEFVANIEYDAIPDEVRQRIKLLILDALGCGLYGADLEWSRILQRRLGELDTTKTCSVWGKPQKLSAPHAARDAVLGLDKLDDAAQVARLLAKR